MIFKDIRNSIHNLQFYQERKSASFGKAFGYFTKLSLLVAFCMMVIFGFRVIPTIISFVSNDVLDSLTQQYPEDLHVVVKQGHLSIDKPEPYLIAYPDAWRTSATQNTSSTTKNILVIDTKKPFVLENFAAYDTSILITQEYIVSQKSGGELSVNSLKSMPDTTIDRAKVASWIDDIRPLLKFVIPVVLAGIFIVSFLGMLIGNMIFLLIWSLVMLIIAKIRKTPITYGQYYKLGFYGLTTVIIFDLVLKVFGLYMPWYADGLLFILMMLYNTGEIK